MDSQSLTAKSTSALPISKAPVSKNKGKTSKFRFRKVDFRGLNQAGKPPSSGTNPAKGSSSKAQLIACEARTKKLTKELERLEKKLETCFQQQKNHWSTASTKPTPGNPGTESGPGTTPGTPLPTPGNSTATLASIQQQNPVNQTTIAPANVTITTGAISASPGLTLVEPAATTTANATMTASTLAVAINDTIATKTMAANTTADSTPVASTIDTTMVSSQERSGVISANQTTVAANTIAANNATITVESFGSLPELVTMAPAATGAGNATTTMPPLTTAINGTNPANTIANPTSAGSTIAPTSLPSLESLLADGVRFTLISNLQRTLVKYQQQNPATDLSALTANLEEMVQYYEVVTMVIGISAFTRTIKDSHPDIAKIYDTKLKKITDEIKQTIDSDKSDDSRPRRSLIKQMVTMLLNELYTFTKAPMNEEMRAFFKGFEAERDQFAQVMSGPDDAGMPPQFQRLFQQMKDATSVITALDEYGQQIKELLNNGQFAEVGKIALKINILYDAGNRLVTDGRLDSAQGLADPYGDLLAKFQHFELTHLDALSRITDSSPASIPLNEIIAYGYVYDSLRIARLGDSFAEGFCFADVLTLGTAAEYQKIADSLSMMAQSILHGAGYGKYALQVRRILQELSFAGRFDTLKNDVPAFGVKQKSFYYRKIIRDAINLRSKLRQTMQQTSFKSIDKLIDHFLKLFNPLTTHVQLMFRPMEGHVVYMEIRKQPDLYKLTIHDLSSGLHIVTGSTPDELKAAVFSQLAEFRRHYQLPPHSTGAAVPDTGYARLTHELLAPLEEMQLFPDSALTVKDILTTPPAQLQAIDTANTQALIEQYLQEVSKKTNQKLLKQDKKASQPGESSPDSITVKDPIIAQMREVLAALKVAEVTPAKTTPKIPQQVKELNAHVLKTIDLFAKQTTKSVQQSSSSASSDLPTQDWAAMSADELIKLGIKHDFIKLVNPAAAGLKLRVARPVISGARIDSTHDSGDAHTSSVGGNVAGGFASFAAAVGGALTAFKSTCPGCLSDMLSNMIANMQSAGSEDILLDEVTKSGSQALKEGAKETLEEAAKEGSKDALKKGTEDAVEEGTKDALKKGAEDTLKAGARKLVRCRRSGVCDVSRVVKDLLKDSADAAEIAELIGALDAASDAADAIAIKVASDKIANWLKNILSSRQDKDKDHKPDHEISVEQFVEAVRRLKTTPKPATHKAEPPTHEVNRPTHKTNPPTHKGRPLTHPRDIVSPDYSPLTHNTSCYH